MGLFPEKLQESLPLCLAFCTSLRTLPIWGWNLLSSLSKAWARKCFEQQNPVGPSTGHCVIAGVWS